MLEGAEGNRADRGGKAESRKGGFSKVGTWIEPVNDHAPL